LGCDVVDRSAGRRAIDVTDHDAGTTARQQDRSLRADATAGARHHRDLAVELPH
jgi:hypothetical protein